MNRVRAAARLVAALGVLALVSAGLPVHAGTTPTISGRVWDDEDMDGRQDGSEDGLVAEVQLLDTSDRFVGAATAVLPDGAYSLPVPAAGTYHLKVTLTANMRGTRKDDPVVGDRWDSDIDELGWFEPVTVEADDVTHLDAGIMVTDVRGVVYLDRDGNGRWSIGDQPIVDLPIELTPYDQASAVLGRTRTDEDGEFRMIVPPSMMNQSMVVFVALPPGQQTGPKSRTQAGPKGRAPVVRVTQIHNSLEFAVIQPVRIGDRVWFDKNLNGRQDTGEASVSGLKVMLMDPELEYVFASTVSNAKGRYQLVAPVPGKYRLVAVLPTFGGTWSPMRTNLPEAIDSDVRPAGPDPGASDVLTLKDGKNRIDLDIGLRWKR